MSMALFCFLLMYREEQNRQEELSKLKYKIRLLVNDTVVSETKERCEVYCLYCMIIKCHKCTMEPWLLNPTVLKQ